MSEPRTEAGRELERQHALMYPGEDNALLRTAMEINVALIEAQARQQAYAEVEGLRAAATDVVDGRWMDEDGETGSTWCHFCEVMPDYPRGKPVERHAPDCSFAALRAALQSPVSPTEPREEGT